MKKFRVFLVIACLLIGFSSTNVFAAKFYDTIGTEYEGVVDRVAALGIINGISDKTFAPNKGLTRAEFAKIITYTKGLDHYATTIDLPSSFKDVKKDYWAKNYIMVATDLGLLKGYEDGTFRPEKEVSYAEFIAVTLRTLGYVNIDETSGTTWYSGYVKRMFDINLNEGMSSFKSYELSAKRGDVAMMWWNMLISDKWAISAESETSGLYYTYSNTTQLEYLFPDFRYVKGRVNSISSGMSGDLLIDVQLGSRHCKTSSSVPIYAYGAMGSGVLNPKSGILYGFAIDEDYDDFEVVSGPTFYLKEQGYKLDSAKSISSFGSKDAANYAYAIVAKDSKNVFRTVYLDASDSYLVQSVNIGDAKNEEAIAEDDEEDVEEYEDERLVYLNNEEEAFTTTSAAVIVKGKLVNWESIPENAILTELIPDMLYTFETKVIDGEVTNYDKLSELYIDNDRYIVFSDCEYTIYGEENDNGNLKVMKFSKIKTQKFEELLSRDVEYHLNVAEEICFIEFGKYLPSNILEKYDNGDYRFFYIDSIGYRSDEDVVIVGGKSFGGKLLKYDLSYSDGLNKGVFVYVSNTKDGTLSEYEILDSSAAYGDDISLIYDFKLDESSNIFGEYSLTDKTLFYKVYKYYEENSTDSVERVVMQQVNDIDEIENLSKYKLNLLVNENMDLDIVIAERDLNKAVYPVGKVSELVKYTGDSEVYDPTSLEVKVKVATVGDTSFTAIAYSGDLAWGELITYDPDSIENHLIVKERFKTEVLGYKGDIVVHDVEKNGQVATVVGNSSLLDFSKDTFDYKGREYDLLDYKYLLTTVRWEQERNSWGFKLTRFYDKEEIELKPGDRIAFGELNGIAVIYRGYTD